MSRKILLSLYLTAAGLSLTVLGVIPVRWFYPDTITLAMVACWALSSAFESSRRLPSLER